MTCILKLHMKNNSFKRYIVGLMVVLSMSYSCTQKNGTTDVSVLDETKMAHILADAHLSESISKIEGDRYQLQFDLDQAYDIVFEKHGTNFEEFNASLTYYQNQPEKLEAIYDEVIVILSEMQAQNSTKKSKSSSDNSQ